MAESSTCRRNSALPSAEFYSPTFRVRREVLGQPRVSVIVSTSKGNPEMLISNLRANTTYKNHEVLVLDIKKRTLTGDHETRKLEGT